MSGAPALDPESAALALRLRFLLEALALDLLPPSLADPVRAASGTSADMRQSVNDVRQAFLEAQASLGLEGLAWPPTEAEASCQAARASVEPVAGEAAPRAAAERLGRFCELLLQPGRRASGSYYTPAWIADEIAETVVRGTLIGRGAGAPQVLSFRLLDPAMGAGAFAVAAMEAIAGAMGEGREENDVRRVALRDCIFGLELNPVAAEASRMALWLAGSRPGRPARVPADHLSVQDALSAPPPPRSFDIVLGNPPWGVKLSAEQAQRLAAAAPKALSGHRDSYLFFLQLAADTARDDGAVGLVLPDTVLSQVRYQGMRRSLLERFRPLKVALLGESIFAGATAPACLLCLTGKEAAPESFPTLDLRRVPRSGLDAALSQAGSPTPRDAPTTASHSSFLLPSAWLRQLLARLTAALAPLAAPGPGFEFHDVGINYPRAEIGRALLYSGTREHPDDIPVARGRDFAPFSEIAHSAWLRHDWRARIGAAERVSVREPVYRLTPKILFRQTADRPVATLDRRGVWFGRSVIAITGKTEHDLLALLAVLNSRAFAALYRAVAPEGGRAFAQVKVSKLALLPVPGAGREKLAGLAAALLDATDIAARSALVKRLDAAVYRAYGLSRGEIASIEEMIGPCLRDDASSSSRRARRPQREATS